MKYVKPNKKAKPIVATNSKQTRKTKKRKLRIAGLDVLLSVVLLAALIYLFYILIPMEVLPATWVTLAVLVGVILLLLNLILSMIRQPMATHWVRRLVVVLLVGAFGFASYSVQKVDEAITEVMQLPTSVKEYVSIIMLRDAKLTDIRSLQGKTVGLQRTFDAEHMDIATQHLKDSGVSFKTDTFQDYASAVKALYDKDITAIVMSESYRTLVEETYEDFADKTAIVDAAEIEIPVMQIVKPIDITANSFTVFVSGIDTLGKASLRTPTDANLIVTVNPLTKHIVINSIPRDAYLPNACMGNRPDKLTHTGLQGIDCTIRTIEQALDIDINYYAKITFSSVIDAIDTLGGIDVNVPMDFCERPANRNYSKKNIVYVKKGQQTLTGAKALALARHRKTVKDGDLGRAKNQQLVVNAMIKKAASPDTLGKIDQLIQVVSDTVQTNLTKKEIYRFANAFASDLKPWTFTNHVIKGVPGWGETASIPGMELSIVNLSQDDMDTIKYVIKMATSDTDLSAFQFSTNNLVIKDIPLDGETTGAEGTDFCHLN